MDTPYRIETFPEHLKYLIRTPRTESKLIELFGKSPLSSMQSYYIEVDLKRRTWNPSFDYCWLYRNQPPISTVEEIKQLLNN